MMKILVPKYYTTGNSNRMVMASNTEEMTLYVPILLDDKGNVLEMYEHPIVTGDTTTAIIDTQYGKALKISGSAGDVGINMRQTNRIQREKQLEEAFDGAGQ